MILHAHELGPPVLLGRKLHQSELICPHGAGSNVADFARLDQIMKGLHCFFNGHCGIETVYLKEVEIGCIKASERCVHGGEDGLAGETYGNQYLKETASNNGFLPN